MENFLGHVHWDINDVNLEEDEYTIFSTDDDVNDITLNRDQFIQFLQNNRVRWITDSRNPNKVTFEMSGLTEEPVYLSYRTSDLPDYLHVLGVIGNYYKISRSKFYGVLRSKTL